MAIRITIMVDKKLANRVSSHTEQRGETLTHFYNRAVINQLENDGDFEIRDIVEEAQDDDKEQE